VQYDLIENYINTEPDTLLFITDTTNISSHITTDLITHRCTIIDHFNKV